MDGHDCSPKIDHRICIGADESDFVQRQFTDVDAFFAIHPSEMHDHAARPDHSRRELPCCHAAHRINDQTKRIVADGTSYRRIYDSEEIFVLGGFAPARIGISDGDISSPPAG